MVCSYCLGKKCRYCNNTGIRIQKVSKDSNERYTPPSIIERARQVMGSIDIDPASCDLANTVVHATKYYTLYTNGLQKRWDGNIFCNPPYGVVPGMVSGMQELFIKKGMEEYYAGRAKQIIYVLDARAPYNPYFNPLWDYPLCFCTGRVYFWNEEEEAIRGPGTVIAYVGPYRDLFTEVFGTLGVVAEAISPFRDTETPSLEA